MPQRSGPTCSIGVGPSGPPPVVQRRATSTILANPGDGGRSTIHAVADCSAQELVRRLDYMDRSWLAWPAGSWIELVAANGFYRLTRGTFAQFGLDVPRPEACISDAPRLAPPRRSTLDARRRKVRSCQWTNR